MTPLDLVRKGVLVEDDEYEAEDGTVTTFYSVNSDYTIYEDIDDERVVYDIAEAVGETFHFIESESGTVRDFSNDSTVNLNMTKSSVYKG